MECSRVKRRRIRWRRRRTVKVEEKYGERQQKRGEN
jgi:hypothetical protein